MQLSLQHVFSVALTQLRSNTPCTFKMTMPIDICLAASDGLRYLFAARTDIQPKLIENSLDQMMDFLQSQSPFDNPAIARLYESLLKTLTTLIIEVESSDIELTA